MVCAKMYRPRFNTNWPNSPKGFNQSTQEFFRKCTSAILRGWKTLWLYELDIIGSWRETRFIKRLINELWSVQNCIDQDLIQIDQIHQKALTNLLKNFLENGSGWILPDQNYMYSRARYNWFLKRDQLYQKALTNPHKKY